MPTSIIGLSGPSSSGKTTLARLLQRIFSNQPQDQPQTGKQISTFIIHEDDFYQPDDRIPYTTTKSGERIQDWDCLGALDINFLTAALRYVHEHGHLPPRLRSKEDLNDVSPGSGVEDTLVDELRKTVSARMHKILSSSTTGEEKLTLALLEGFLLYAPPEKEKGGCGHGLRGVHDQIDLPMFLAAPYGLVKERREKRSGYVTIGPAPTTELPQRSSSALEAEEGGVDLEAEDDRPPQNFWTDPPGYVDDVVWPRYVRDHAWLLLPEDGGADLSTEDEDDLIKRAGQGVKLRTDAGVTVAPGQGDLPMADLLKWAVEEVLKHVGQSTEL
ncbi:ribosylnicotinamide kinase [Aspergillus mulundensis]|uniref:Nicotinamide riboside kinase n=1 Tax=Aspergillus mulundensis TaxID=1810919 RepID=A0A3D8S4I8_9EURO|nr:hypothetical protein DSM5745_04667 [Aspergillus mulundensis]RDW81110.1 hypothetical protein DSM5745_04667 [Aspergillus mulundensis]